MTHDNGVDSRNGAAVLDAPRTNGKQIPAVNRTFHTRAKVGHPAPAFSMPTTHDLQRLQSRVVLDDYRGQWLVLFFYPLDFTFVCPTEILALSDRYEEFAELRGLFIIDPAGILQYAVVHNLNIGRSVDETLRVLEALQTGGLCAADWQPGQPNLSTGA